MIKRKVDNGLRGSIEHISCGEEMTEGLNSPYRHAGAIQTKSFFKELLSLRYEGSNPINFLSQFRRKTSDIYQTGLELSEGVAMILFKIAVKAKSFRWFDEVSQAARYTK